MTPEPREFSRRLLSWFDMHGRHSLPWQQNPTPYRVWVSEVMLQQTQVATVIPYYERFMQRFDSVEALAAAPVDEVMHLWTGLGYYARARNLLACARVVVAQHGGVFPRDLEAMNALPGIGRSTAGAILALAHDDRHPILDGNVKRVLARVFGIAGDPGSAAVNAALWATADTCTPATRVGAYTQAIMDLGATTCARSRPACTVCPMNTLCVAAREGRQAELPGRKPRRTRPAREAILLIAETGQVGARSVLVERRPSPGIWGGLWSPPQFDTEQAALEWCGRELGELPGVREPLAPIAHAFTHFDLQLQPIRVLCAPGNAVREGEERLWYSLEAPPRVGLPQPIRTLFERLNSCTMARRVQCVVLKREAEGLDYLPYPGDLGKRIYASVSKEAWAQWVAHQTMLINENRLTPIEPKARAFLVKEMEKFFFGEGSAKPAEFVPK